MLPEDLELNPSFKNAFEAMDETDQHLFVTGKAGTGKSTLLWYFRNHTDKTVAYLAPTGVAAVNIQGETIHSFFGFRPDITVKKVRENFQDRDRDGLFEELDAILIDEISMVRADLLDCVNELLKMHGPEPGTPFGGIQMILIGDLYQLPPVVTSDEKDHFESVYDSPYFFDSRVMEEMDLKMIELQKVYRQTDSDFLDLLNAVRKRTVSDEHLERLRDRVQPEFDPEPDEMYIHLTPTNSKAQRINQTQLDKLEGDEKTFSGTRKGDFDEGALPTREELTLKEGAQVMMVNNDSDRRWVNGTIGRIVGFDQEEGKVLVQVRLEEGSVVDVEPYEWEMYQFTYDPEAGTLVSETIGSFEQYPLTLAWAITIHKSQGKTYDRVIIDYDRGMFAHGQAYVALSRCTTLDGLVLKKPVEEKHIFTDWRIQKFLTDTRYLRANQKMPVEEKQQRISAAIENDQDLHLVYLKSNDTRSERRVTPEEVGEMSYQGHPFDGLKGYCHKRDAERVFNLEKILQLSVVGEA